MNYWKARTLQQLNRDEEALAAFDKALVLHENEARWWIGRSLSCEKLKRYEEALANAEGAIALDGSNGDGWKLKGYALMLRRRALLPMPYWDAMQPSIPMRATRSTAICARFSRR